MKLRILALPALLFGCLPMEDLEDTPGVQGGEITACGADAPCLHGLVCVTGRCVRPCVDGSQCASGLCNPLPDGGWCAPLSDVEPGAPGVPDDAPPVDAPGDDGERAPPPPADDEGALPPAEGDRGAPPPDRGDEGAPPPPDEEAPPPSEPNDPAPAPPEDDPEAPGETEPPPAPERCVYPAPSRELRLGATMPAMSWADAQHPSAGAGLDLERVFCEGTYETITFVVGTGWCPSCPEYIRNVSGLAQGIESADGVVVYVEVEDASYNPATSRSASRFIDRLIGQSPGYRVGDADTRPQSGLFANAPIVRSYPSAFVVRTSDMRIIADQGSTNQLLPFDQIARDPLRRWSGRANCGGGEEEAMEPNDTPDEAGRIGAETVQGGVCGTDLDFYYVDLPGRWRLDLDFRHRTGDLDVYVWDRDLNGPALDGAGGKIGSDSADDGESFTHEGPALVAIVGFQLATSPYRLTVTAQ